jgi:DNA invertase Pin-like site-specific DNA recombinase
MKRAVIYARISQDRSGKAAGIERQLSECRELAERSNLEVVDEFIDNDVSAYRHKPRPQWKRLLERITTDDIDAIVTWHTDRLYRSLADLSELLAVVEIRDMRIVTKTAGELDLSSATGRMVAVILSSVARQEVEHKAERQALAAEAKANTGKYHGGRRPIGYEKDGKTIRESEAVVLRAAADKLIGGESLAATTRFVSDALDYPNRPKPKANPEDPDVAHGTPMNTHVLRQILTSPRIVGMRQYLSQADRRRMAAEPDYTPSMTVTDGTWPGILSSEQWEAVRAVLKPDRRRTGSRAPRSLLAGLVRCGHPECTEGVMGHSGRGYQCSAHQGGCGRVSIAGRGLEQMVEQMVVERLKATDMQLLVDDEPLDDAARHRQALQDKFDALLVLYDNDLISAKDLADRRRRLKEQLGDIGDRQARQALQAATLRKFVTIVGAWDEATMPEKASVIRTIVDRVIVKPAKNAHASGPRFDPARVDVIWK